MMKNQNLLDELGKLSKKERQKAIAKKSNYILSDEFIEFMKGQIEFAELSKKNPFYFERIYIGEDTDFIEFMKSEMEQHSKTAAEVWKSIEDYVEKHDMEVLFKTGMASVFESGLEETNVNDLPCAKCDELIRLNGLCTGCLSGRLPKQIAETLQRKSVKDTASTLVEKKEILRNTSINKSD